MTKTYIVQHTHWDREWYFTTADAQVLSDQLFTEMLDELENNKQANFCLDGQSSIVDDYLELRPEKLTVIRNLIEEGRLFVGPWYTQTDALLVDAESILRNLIIGINDTVTKYGKPMMLGYLPDTFGFNAQLPTLLNQVGIDNFLFWRGINFEKVTESPYFIWKGLGEKSVYAINFPFGYMTGMMSLEAENNLEEFVKERLDLATEFNQNHGNNKDILIPAGIDQKNIVRDLDQILTTINKISKYDNSISDYPAFVDIIRKKKGLPEYKGELREPVYSRVHRSISSVRTKVKLKNFELEQKILRQIEPLAVIAKSNGVDISNGLIRKLWKKVLETQAHDSIGGCVSDNVAADIQHRLKEAEEIADGIENLIGKRIADALQLDCNQIIVFNTDSAPFKGEKILHVVTPQKNITFDKAENPVIIDEKYYASRKDIMKLVAKGYDYFDEPAYYELFIRADVELPALGYKIISFTETDQQLPEQRYEQSQMDHQVSIENSYYRIVYENGTVVLKTAFTQIDDFVQLTDAANDGDTYDYSPLEGDIEKAVLFSSAGKWINDKQQVLILEGAADLPYDLEDRISGHPKTGKLSFAIELTLSADSDLINGKIHVENHILSHRLRLKLNVLNEDETSIAQIQNGFIENKPEEIPENWKEKYVEKPVNLEVFDKSVSVNNRLGSASLFARGLKEYERSGKYLYLTLMSTTGQLGKANLAWRPGRASGDTTNEGHIMMPVPLAQEIGEQAFTFAVRVVNESFDEQTTAAVSYKWMAPSISYQLQTLNVFVKRLDNKIWPLKYTEKPDSEASLLKLPEEFIVSALYPAYRCDGHYVLRLANPTGKPLSIPDSILSTATIINALEEPIEAEKVISPYDYISLLYKFN